MYLSSSACCFDQSALPFPVIVLNHKAYSAPKDHTHIKNGKELRLEQNLEKELREAMGDIECPKGFKCCTEGLEKLCKAQDVGLEEFLECLEENPLECTFSVHYGAVFYCRCPLRVYIVKKFGK